MVCISLPKVASLKAIKGCISDGMCGKHGDARPCPKGAGRLAPKSSFHILQPHHREDLIEFRSPAFALLWFLPSLQRKEEYFDLPGEHRTARKRVNSLPSTNLS
ncbi:hypothetical protein HBI56_182470 [Parastagonospora nodorum]|uniref:Uncharacterized protein n=1 Tax=Phaeosphaeria nodorum (strain SN15 / ATCC MYA-4574 / FGSC 10173) TaxID=321614 RepID=A0A7U2I693_PHANO|nr:hypothetical protein HBH56_187880 [Parastagonospora nodorum]QRD00933.1 hypothetical protein JI435_415980 [Parastagonospora nodorum SN15]KAH3925257.1 hypothetical protein HBH54_180670 [Parastagonospora nodorum]KAH3953324.1 hypothetical protein HBH53_035340 [Parastagonospora nodorum]KAH3959122.1 hypothetical protein HBH52_246400 [Parastagonospora nodorum]